MRNQGIGSWPARRARKTPHRTALVHGGHRHSYADLHERSTRLAHALRTAGIRRGDRIAYLGPNHPSFLETLFAAGLLGALFVPLNTRLALPEIAHQLDDCGARALIHAPGCAPLVPSGAVPVTVRTGEEYESWLAGADRTPIDEPVGLDDTCLIMYTSGTTGRPKGAMLTHGNLTWNAYNVLVDTDLLADDVALVSAPLFHTGGLNMLTLPVLLKGGACLLTESFDPAGALELIARERISYMFGVPTMYDLMARQDGWADADLRSLRILNCGGAPVPRPLIDTYLRRGLSFQQGYGMTEAGPGVLFLDAEHTAGKAGSAGVPHFFTDVLLTTADGREAGLGEVGEVLVSGPNVGPGYWGLPEATGLAFHGEWFRSGDAARADADGYLTIADRIKDMYISGGENVYPAEVEEALLALPGVAECAVYGVPDPKWGEVGRAVVVPAAGAAVDPDALLAALAGVLAKYKLPRTVLLADELPRTASGKILKHRLRARHDG
ncbi:MULTISPECIES: long-chain fatty acid--CoA ligase [Kitasatospora]|uniref:Putative acyl-CoA synthetase n=1 Tax=Kitasatospora setae (strain ATCC 33774 / DSM 43861 / JCM 3304 / KCC A-0304 / NBRC 14216 / KM-6054) TaxID=452652 RepID=E4NJU1_KITSK|nr:MULTISPECIES: long-chain fatty acid--CoA ligase [Kitasatospora]BAJ33239.1 putative acyl-CoA synthetase [Kitasatospora setae KM-6054]